MQSSAMRKEAETKTESEAWPLRKDDSVVLAASPRCQSIAGGVVPRAGERKKPTLLLFVRPKRELFDQGGGSASSGDNPSDQEN